MRRTDSGRWAALAFVAIAIAIAAIAGGAQAAAPQSREETRPAPPPSSGEDPTDAVSGTLVEGGARRFAKKGVALDADLVQIAPKDAAPAGADPAAVATDGGCIVCDGPAGPDALHDTYKGRTVTICRACGMAAWQEQRDVHIAKLQARGVLFDEQVTHRALFGGWMWFGVWALAGVVCAAAASQIALTKGIAPLPWLLAALAFNVVPLLLIAMKPAADLSRLPQGVPAGLAKIATTVAPLPCATCGADNHPTAKRCIACGAALTARGESESARALRGESK